MRLQLDRRRDDHAGQPHAADGGPEQLGLGAVRGQRADGAVRGDQVHRQHVVAEAALGVVVLAVDVRADRAADRDLPGARQHRHPPAERQGGPHERVQADAAVDDRDARVGVDRGRAGEPGHLEHEAARVLCRVAVGAAETAGDHPARAGARDRGHHVGGRAGDGDVREGRGGAPPAVQARGRGRGAGHREPGYAPATSHPRRRSRPPAHTFRGCRTACDDRRTCCAGCAGPARCAMRSGVCDDRRRSRRRRPAIVGARRYDPPVRRLTPATGVGNGGARGHIGARGVGDGRGGRRGVAGPARRCPGGRSRSPSRCTSPPPSPCTTGCSRSSPPPRRAGPPATPTSSSGGSAGCRGRSRTATTRSTPPTCTPRSA